MGLKQAQNMAPGNGFANENHVCDNGGSREPWEEGRAWDGHVVRRRSVHTEPWSQLFADQPRSHVRLHAQETTERHYRTSKQVTGLTSGLTDPSLRRIYA